MRSVLCKKVQNVGCISVAHAPTLFIGVCFALLLLCGTPLQAAEINARIDRNPVAENESVELVLEASQQPSSEPDLSPLRKDFDILNTSQSSNIQIINGQSRASYAWHLTLMPKRGGQLRIPPIYFGKQRSQPINLRVTPTNTATAVKGPEKLILNLESDARQVYLRAQLLVTVRLYLGAQIGDARLSDP